MYTLYNSFQLGLYTAARVHIQCRKFQPSQYCCCLKLQTSNSFFYIDRILSLGLSLTVYYAPAARVGALSDDARLTSVCLTFVAYIGPKSRTERPRKIKIGTEVAHVKCDSDTTFKVKRSKVNLQGAEAYCDGIPQSLLTFTNISTYLLMSYLLQFVCSTSLQIHYTGTFSNIFFPHEVRLLYYVLKGKNCSLTSIKFVKWLQQ